LNIIFHPFAASTLLGRFVPFLAGRVTRPTLSSKSNFNSIDSGVWGLRVPKIWGSPLTLRVALTTVLRTTVLHCVNVYCIANRQWSVLPRLPRSTSIACGWLLQLKPSRACKTPAACYLIKCHWTVTPWLPWCWCAIQIRVLVTYLLSC